MSVAPRAAADFGARGGLPTGPVSLEPYRSADFFARERDHVFARAWLLIGRIEDVPDRGDFVVREIEICNASILIVHGSDGVIRGFHNVCPHRANQIVWEASGNARAFVCRYHNWSFALDGSLRGVPDQAMFLDLDRSRCGLPTVAFEIWDGWMFVNLSPTPDVSLDTFLGDFKPFFAGLDYAHAGSPIVLETRIRCNWKVVMDAFAEAYHIPAIHPTSLKPMFSNQDNMFGRLLDARFFGPHRSVSMFGNAAYAPSPDQKVERLVSDPRFVAPDHIARLANFAGHPAVNPTRAANWSMDVNAIFPNSHIDANAGGVFLHQFWPLSINETRHQARFYARPPQTVRDRLAQEFATALAADIVLEDLSNVERTQRGIDSRGSTAINLSESEVSIRHGLHHLVRWTQALSARQALSP